VIPQLNEKGTTSGSTARGAKLTSFVETIMNSSILCPIIPQHAHIIL
jgi:hypothetical protein